MKRAHRETMVFSLSILMVLGWLSVSAAHAEDPKAIEASWQRIPSGALGTVNESMLSKGVEDVSVTVCPGLGVKIFGSEKRHDLVLVSGHWGKMFTGLMGANHWYQGHLERWSELFGGFQYFPDHSYVLGVAIGLRYHFITSGRWSPFLDAGAGLAATDIGKPDLGSTFEFNLQVGGGIHYFINKNMAMGMHVRWFHLSNGGLTSSNMGVNSLMYLFGMTWFF
jgi:opacity protein-like surface antigen